jgi:hypothetical protein
MDKVRINTCLRKLILRGAARQIVDPSVDVIDMYNKGSMHETRPYLQYNLYGDTYLTSNNYSGEFRLLSHVTLLNSKPLVRGSGKSIRHSTR